MIEVASRISGRILFGADMTKAFDLLKRFQRISSRSPHRWP
jgi:hypothetical protein